MFGRDVYNHLVVIVIKKDNFVVFTLVKTHLTIMWCNLGFHFIGVGYYR